MEEMNGGLLLDVTPQYAYFVYRDHSTDYLVLKLTTHYDGDNPVWQYVDHIDLPVIPPDYRLIHGMCQIGETYDSRLAAVVKDVDEEVLTSASHAWQAKLEEGKIAVIATKDISCINEGYGV